MSLPSATERHIPGRLEALAFHLKSRLFAGKVENLRRAARAFHGVEVPARRVFSFWRQLGPVTRRNRMLRLLIAAVSLLVLSSFPGKAQDPVVPEERAVSSALPGPERARAAAARVRPELENALASKGLRFGDPVFLRAFKEEGELELWVFRADSGKYEHFRTWKVAAQSGRIGPKLAEGDGQVPEGFYFVPPAGMKPDSVFHLAFNIGFPNAYDRHHGRTGSFIMIHGNRISIGCLAMTDPKIEEIYTLCDAALKAGQPYFRIHVFPFRMTTERLEREKDHEWFGFWTNLKEGHDHFERTGKPPETTVEAGVYRFK